MRNQVKVILPCFAASLGHPTAIDRPIFTQALTSIQLIIDFNLMSQYKCHTDDTIQYLEQYLNNFHDHKDVFKEYQHDKSIRRKVIVVTTRIQVENSEVLNQHHLSGDTTTKRHRSADQQYRHLDGIKPDLDREDMDFHFLKIDLLSYLVAHMRCYAYIQISSTKSEDSCHKSMIKKGDCRSNRKDASYQILQTYTRLGSVKIPELKVKANITHLIQYKLHKKEFKH